MWDHSGGYPVRSINGTLWLLCFFLSPDRPIFLVCLCYQCAIEDTAVGGHILNLISLSVDQVCAELLLLYNTSLLGLIRHLEIILGSDVGSADNMPKLFWTE